MRNHVGRHILYAMRDIEAENLINMVTVNFKWSFIYNSKDSLRSALHRVDFASLTDVRLNSLNQRNKKDTARSRQTASITIKTWATNQLCSHRKVRHAQTCLSIVHYVLQHFRASRAQSGNTTHSHIWYVSTPSPFQVFQTRTSFQKYPASC